MTRKTFTASVSEFFEEAVEWERSCVSRETHTHTGCEGRRRREGGVRRREGECRGGWREKDGEVTGSRLGLRDKKKKCLTVNSYKMLS